MKITKDSPTRAIEEKDTMGKFIKAIVETCTKDLTVNILVYENVTVKVTSRRTEKGWDSTRTETKN